MRNECMYACALKLLSITSGRGSNLSDAAIVDSLRSELQQSKEAAGSQLSVIAELKGSMTKLQAALDDALQSTRALEKENASWEQQVKSMKESHSRELAMKDDIINAKREEAKKWQIMHMSMGNVDIAKYQQFATVLNSPPSKGSSSQDAS